MTIVKIKIEDNSEIRNQIDKIYENTTQIDLAKWSINLAIHILELVDIDYRDISEIVEGFKVNEQWQIGKVRMHYVRQAGFKIHKLARESNTEIEKIALRVVGQAVGTGHMREHAMVASDYAIKLINILYPDNMEEVTKERIWQLEELKKVESNANRN